jgi:hypothetical protein
MRAHGRMSEVSRPPGNGWRTLLEDPVILLLGIAVAAAAGAAQAASP